MRYLDGQPSTNGVPPTVVVQAPSAPPRFRKTKRLFKNIGIFILLAVAGGLILALFGDGGLESTKNFVESRWWPSTLVRYLAYAGAALWLLPRTLRRMREEAIERLHLRRAALLAEGVVDHDAFQAIAAAEARIQSKKLLNPWWGFAVMVALDLLLYQLPYLLR